MRTFPCLIASVFLAAPTLGGPAIAPAAPVAALAPALGAGGYHVDKRFGYKFKAPKEWSQIAVKTDEAWLTTKYLSDKKYFYTDELTKYTTDHTPELLCIAFIHENMNKKSREVDEKTEDGVSTTTITFNNPYKNYEDFLDRTYSGGGFFIDEKKKSKVGDVEVTQYVIKVEKLSRNGPKRIVTWIYHAPDIDFAVQIEVLEDAYPKLKKILKRTFGSFKLVERTEGKLPTSGKTNDGMTITIRDMEKGTPKERRTKRVESEEQLHRRAVERLPEEWEDMKTKGLLVLSHTDKKYAKRVGEHCAAMLKWFDKTFPYIGKTEYVRAPIIRVCKDQEENGAFSRGVNSGGGWWMGTGGEIVTNKGQSGFTGFEIDNVNRRLFGYWFQERDRDLSSALPEWLGNGLFQYVEGGRAKGSKIDFRVDRYSQTEARLAVGKGTATSPRDLIRMTRDEFSTSAGGSQNGETYWSRRTESAMLVRFLISKDSKRCKQAKGLLEEYLSTLNAIINEQDEDDNKTFKDEEEAEPETEEEEEERAKARANRWRQQEKQLMESVFDRVFADWSDSDWKSFESAYFKYLS